MTRVGTTSKSTQPTSVGYELENLKLPTLSGRALRVFAALLRTPLIGRPLLNKLVADAGIPKLLLARLPATPTFHPPITGTSDVHTGEVPNDLRNVTGMSSVRDYARAYQHGHTSATEVAEAVLEAIERSNDGALPLRAVIRTNRDDVLRQALASTRRHQEGKARGVFDGVPVAVKDELDMLPYPTGVGTSFLGSKPAAFDATVVRRLREAGVLLIGKTNMYEIGISPESHNMHHGVVRNPYDLAHQTGGSSSGSAAAVAAGICPLAIGADGGGSIRVPAALCGVVGLKATYGRFSEYGAAPLCSSLAHVGPIAATTQDVALFFEVTSGPDKNDPMTLRQPPGSLGNWATSDLSGVRLGIYRPWFEHAQQDVVATCSALVEQLGKRGASVREIEVEGLDLMRIAQAVTILSEMAAAMEEHRDQFRRHAPAVQIPLLAGREFRAEHYVLAQRVRTMALGIFRDIFETVDAIVTPTTAVTAPRIPPGSAHLGWSNINSVTELMRFVFAANLTGLPAISFPAGYDGQGLPVGMQAMSTHFNEAVLLRISWVAEQMVKRRRPNVLFRPLLP